MRILAVLLPNNLTFLRVSGHSGAVIEIKKKNLEFISSWVGAVTRGRNPKGRTPPVLEQQRPKKNRKQTLTNKIGEEVSMHV